MTDIFISYAREDEKQASKLVRKLRAKGFNIWRDVESLHSGQLFIQEIQQAIQNAKDVVVLWSKAAASSEWVQAEATFARNKRKKLHSLVIEKNTEVPLPFNAIHALDFSNWDGSEEDPLFKKLLEDLTAEAQLTNLTKQSWFGSLKWLVRRQKRIIATIMFLGDFRERTSPDEVEFTIHLTERA